MKKQCKYIVNYKWDVTGSKSKSSPMSRSGATNFAQKLRKQNKISAHNTSIIRGKAFIPYKNIKINKVCKR